MPNLDSRKCSPGHYGVGGSKTATCSGKCAPGFFCTAGSTSNTQHECGANNR